MAAIVVRGHAGADRAAAQRAARDRSAAALRLRRRTQRGQAAAGGGAPSCILTWLKEKYQVPIVAYLADVGQEEDFDKVIEKAH
ncbi:MAG: argininosuccinate synthase, partial [Burkholderiales bacterium]|nr:argininosuccinate synthase [Burkholderiales bacterium]